MRPAAVTGSDRGTMTAVNTILLAGAVMFAVAGVASVLMTVRGRFGTSDARNARLMTRQIERPDGAKLRMELNFTGDDNGSACLHSLSLRTSDS